MEDKNYENLKNLLKAARNISFEVHGVQLNGKDEKVVERLRKDLDDLDSIVEDLKNQKMIDMAAAHIEKARQNAKEDI